MKLAVNTYSYSQLAQQGKTIYEIIDTVCESGFSAIEFSHFNNPEGITMHEHAKKVKDYCDSKNLEVVNYAVRADLLTGCNGNMKDQIELLKEHLETTRLLGSKKMRHDTSFGPSKENYTSFDSVLDRLAEGCLEVTKIAEQMGIMTTTENHGTYCQDSERIEKLICKVNHKNFRVLLDMGNFMCADEEPEKAAGRLIPYAAYFHVKDFHFKRGMMPNPGDGFFTTRAGNYIRGAIAGHGDVPVYQIIKLAKNYGYDGILSIEFEGMEDCVRAVKIGKANVERFWNM